MKEVQNFAGLLGIVAAMAGALALGTEGFDTWEIAAVVLLFVGAAGCLVVTQPRILVVLWPFDDCVFRLERAQERDVHAMHAIAVEQFGPNVTPQSQMRGFVKRNKNVFWVLLAPRRGGLSFTVEGYLCLIPMTEEMAKKADSHEFDVTVVHPSHLPRPTDQAHAVYIGAVVGRGVRAKGQALGHLLEKAEALAIQTRSKTVYARAASPDGLRLLEKHEFSPVMPEKCGLRMLYRRAYEIDDPEPLLTSA